MKQFTYISEDDGQEHTARHIDWDAVLDTPVHGHTCVRCYRQVVVYCSVDNCGIEDNQVCEYCKSQEVYIGKPVTTQDGCIQWWEDVPERKDELQ